MQFEEKHLYLSYHVLALTMWIVMISQKIDGDNLNSVQARFMKYVWYTCILIIVCVMKIMQCSFLRLLQRGQEWTFDACKTCDLFIQYFAASLIQCINI